MSGFAVLLDGEGTPNESTLRQLRAGIANRGPDGLATAEAAPGVVLSHARFDTTIEAGREALPARHCRRNIWLTGDLRLDNRSDLERELSGRTEHPVVTDADFVLAAYERWSEDLAARLVGDFAFVIWDGERRRILVVRDQLGIRPAFWTHSPGRRFAAASTVQACVGATQPPGSPDLEYIADVATFAGGFDDRTVWRGVRRLPGGHCLSVDDHGAARVWRYWSPPQDHLDIDIDTARETMRELVTEAVRCRLRSSSDVAVEVSGGLDSTTVAALAVREGCAGHIRPIGLTFPGEACDESRYMRAAECHLGISIEPFIARSAPALDFAERCAATLDLPPLPDQQWTEPFYRRAAHGGSRVVLTGQGGDEVLAANRQGLVEDLFRQSRLADGWRVTGDITRAATGRCRLAATELLRARAPMSFSGLQGLRARRRPTPPSFLAPTFGRYNGEMREPAPFDGPFGASRAARSWCFTDTGRFIDLFDSVAVDGGVECRHPFRDIRVVEFASRLGEDVLAADGPRRGLHRRTFGDLLPSSILDRTDKAEFSLPWVAAGLAPARQAEQLARRLGGRSFVDADRLRTATAGYGAQPFPTTNPWHWWGAVSVALWQGLCASPELAATGDEVTP